MTALCGGGPSGPQAGVGGVLTLGAAAIETFIASVLVLPELAPILAPIIAGLVDIQIASYCGTDPPSDPGLLPTDIAEALAFPATGATFAAQQKVLQWFEHQYWYTICQCNTTTTPAPPAPSNPGPVTTDPGLPTQSTPCWNVTVPWTVPAHSAFDSGFRSYAPDGLPPGQSYYVPYTFPGGPSIALPAVAMPAGATNLQLQGTLNEPISASAGQLVIQSDSFNSVGNPTGSAGLQIIYNISGVSSGSKYTTPRLASTEAYRSLVVGNDDTIDHTGTLTFSFFCAPGTSVGAACCPPDPLLEGELQQILQYVQAIYAGLPIPPSSFSEGTVHSGLTGAGSVTFSGVPIALKVDLTTIPSWVGLEVGNPNFYFDVGYLSFGTSEGNYAQSRLELQHQVVTVPVLAGSVGYTLNNGVVATITELLPGP